MDSTLIKEKVLTYIRKRPVLRVDSSDSSTFVTSTGNNDQIESNIILDSSGSCTYTRNTKNIEKSNVITKKFQFSSCFDETCSQDELFTQVSMKIEIKLVP